MDYHVSDRHLTESLLLRETATFNREEHSQGVDNVWDHTYVTLKTLLLPSQTMQAYWSGSPEIVGKPAQKTYETHYFTKIRSQAVYKRLLRL